MAVLLALGSVAGTKVVAQTNDAAVAPTPPVTPATDRNVAATSHPVEVKISADKPLAISSVGGGPGWMSALIAGVPAAIALIGGLLVVNRSNRQSEKNSKAATDLAAAHAQAATNQKSNELEIARIEAWLAEFYGPFMLLSEENKRIADLLRSRQPNPDFRTLKALLDPAWKKAASKTDLNLINRIVATGVVLRSLIRDKAGPVSPALSDYFALAAAHFTILEMADAGAITHKTEDFNQYVYPRQLDGVLKLERDRLEARRDHLLADLSKRYPAAPMLVIPKELALIRNREPKLPSKPS